MKCFNLKYTSVFQQVTENKEIFTLLLLKEHSLHKYLLIFLCLFNSFVRELLFTLFQKSFNSLYIYYAFPNQTTRSEFDDSQFQVRRRYNDFLWLRQKLEESYPTHLVPVSK